MSNPNVDLEAVINDAVSDSQLPPEPVEDVTAEVTEDTQVETPAEDPSADTPAEDPAADTGEPVAEDPAAAVDPATVQDDFEKRFGIPASTNGRENRIPYSRVKRITEKAVAEVAEVALGRKLAAGEKAIDVVKAHVAQIPELTSRVTEYETRLDKVGEFEDIMANQPERFLQILARVPAYKGFFEMVEQAYNGQAAGNPAVEQEPVDPNAGMPEPDEELTDGSKVYSMEGLKNLLAWQAKQTEARVTKQIEERYKPLESEWQYRQHIEAVTPVIQAQIAEAKTWPLFDENEAEITRVLEANPRISLEGAYRQVVLPKLAADRDKIRQQVLKDVKAAPRSTAVTTRPASKPADVTPSGPRDLADIIAEQVASLKQ